MGPRVSDGLTYVNHMVEYHMLASDDQRLDRTLLALADPTRRAILRRLMRSEARVTDLAAPFDFSLNAISKHIRVLEGAGLVRRRVAGREHHLTFDPRPLEAAAEWIAAQRAFWEPRLAALEAHLVGPRTATAAGPLRRRMRR
jgi:DNA-binding transcriptional ArsR family regulator